MNFMYIELVNQFDLLKGKTNTPPANPIPQPIPFDG